MQKYTLIAGVNGAGKSTLYYLLRDMQKIPRVNMDEINKSIGSWQNPDDVMRAGRIAVNQINAYLEKRISFIQETTLCGKSIIRNINTAKEKGYFIEIHFIGVESSDIAKERIHQRVRNGGHGIPDEDVERRYTTAFLQMKKILSLCNLAVFYDNTTTFRRIAIFKSGKPVRISSVLPKWFQAYFQ